MEAAFPSVLWPGGRAENLMTLDDFGAMLRAEREKKGLTLEEASQNLKIGVRILQSLEECDRENYPHAAYARGFLRTYGAYLGISPEDISAAVGTFGPVNREVVYVAKNGENRRGQLLSPILVQLLAIAIILTLVGGFAYLAWNNGWASSVYNWVVEKTNSFSMSSDVNTRKESQKIAPLSSSLDEDPILTTGASLPRGGTSSQFGRQETQTAYPQQGAPERTDTTLPVTDSHQVVMVAIDDCWVHSSADRIDTRQFSLRKGDTFALSFRDKLEIKLGNAGGVRFRYNGQDIPPVGKSGQVKTVVFPLEATE